MADECVIADGARRYGRGVRIVTSATVATDSTPNEQRGGYVAIDIDGGGGAVVCHLRTVPGFVTTLNRSTGSQSSSQTPSRMIVRPSISATPFHA